MNCKLFDIAAFGRPEDIRLSFDKDESRVPILRHRLRQATFLDGSSHSEMYTDWVEANTGGMTTEIIQRCDPPWDNVFVYAGQYKYPDGVIDSGIHFSRLYPSSQSELLKTALWMLPEESDPKDLYLIGLWESEVAKGARGRVHCTAIAAEIREGKFTGFAMGENEVNLKRPYLHMVTFAPFIFQLAHCKNIITQEHPPYRPRMPKGKRNKVPKITCRTLAISDTLIKREGAQPSGEEGQTAKHICRGNFAHYTEEKPLFGKYAGSFWRPMHVRGKAKHGIVGKDYTLEAKD